MRAQRGSGEKLPSVGELIGLGPAIVERMAIEARPRAETIGCDVLTRAAERAWQAIDRQLSQPAGGVFWIAGAAGTGKTHFLNYALALGRSAGSPPGARMQHLTIGLDAGKDLESRLLEALARGLSLTARDTALWRRMRGAEALALALDQARRLGTETVTVAVDFGVTQSDAAVEYFATLARASGTKQPRLIAIGASRGGLPWPVAMFEVAPADDDERAIVAVGRARCLKQEAKQKVREFYRAVDTGALEPSAIFPFHPFSIEVLRSIANPPGTIAEMARLARDALAPDGKIRDLPYRCLLAPAHLLTSAAICKRVEARLGEPGRAALKRAGTVVGELNGEDARLAEQIVDTLVAAHVAQGSPRLSLSRLQALLPSHWSGMLAPARTVARISALLTTLEERTGGVVRFDSDTVRFDPHGAGAPEVAAFNAALPLIQRFDPSITEAAELPEVKAKLKRLEDAMANALEAARQTVYTLGPVFAAVSDGPSPERQTVLPGYIALASAGPAALLEAAADPAKCNDALKTIAVYEGLAGAAAAAPRIRAMHDYLQATGLKWTCQEDSGKSKKLAALESECQLLASRTTPAVLLDESRNLQAMQARFQQFRWSYAQEYRAAHEQWRQEMDKLKSIAKDARRHLDALHRLNSIAALGAPVGEDLEAPLKDIESRISPCDFAGPLAPEVSPRCPRCGFTLGTRSPAGELKSLFKRIRDALEQRLLALSHSVIVRLIRQHDHGHRLEGFLDIIQAAQTDALVGVLDDDLAAYLARMAGEILPDADSAEKCGTPVSAQGVFRRRQQHRKPGRSKIRP